MKMTKNTYFGGFQGSVTLTLTFDDLEKYIVVLGSTYIHSTIVQMPLMSFINFENCENLCGEPTSESHKTKNKRKMKKMAREVLDILPYYMKK